MQGDGTEWSGNWMNRSVASSLCNKVKKYLTWIETFIHLRWMSIFQWKGFSVKSMVFVKIRIFIHHPIRFGSTHVNDDVSRVESRKMRCHNVCKHDGVNLDWFHWDDWNQVFFSTWYNNLICMAIWINCFFWRHYSCSDTFIHNFFRKSILKPKQCSLSPLNLWILCKCFNFHHRRHVTLANPLISSFIIIYYMK